MARIVKGFHSFTCTPTRLSTNGMNHTYLCFTSGSWSSFTDPEMEGRVCLGTITVCPRPLYVTITVVSCSNHHASHIHMSCDMCKLTKYFTSINTIFALQGKFFGSIFVPSNIPTDLIHTVGSNTALEDSSDVESTALLLDKNCIKATWTCVISWLWTVNWWQTAAVVQSYHALGPLGTSVRHDLCAMIHGW